MISIIRHTSSSNNNIKSNQVKLIILSVELAMLYVNKTKITHASKTSSERIGFGQYTFYKKKALRS